MRATKRINNECASSGDIRGARELLETLLLGRGLLPTLVRAPGFPLDRPRLPPFVHIFLSSRRHVATLPHCQPSRCRMAANRRSLPMC